MISTDCTTVQTRINGSGFNGLAGYATLAFAVTSVSSPAAMVSSTTATPLRVFGPISDAGCGTPSTCHDVFAIAYGPQGGSQSFVLSDEAPGHLIANMVAVGYGNFNIYNALLAIQQNTSPSLAGVLTPSFFLNLQSCSAGAPVFSITLKSLSFSGSAIAVSDDCSVQTVSIQGGLFNGKTGTTSLATTIEGVGSATDVSSTSSSPLSSWTQSVAVGSGTATVTYSVFAILYTQGSTSTPVTTPTLSQWGLFLLAGLLAGAGALGLRRRATPNKAAKI